MGPHRRSVFIGLGAAVVLAVGAWIAGGQIRSPAQIAAETAAPTPSAITVPVERRVLSSEVIVRGTVRYGSPQPVVLADVRGQAGQRNGRRQRHRHDPPDAAARGRRGRPSVMSVSGRPVFVLRGAQPSHRDMRPGQQGPRRPPARGCARAHGILARRDRRSLRRRDRALPSPPGTSAAAGRRSGPTDLQLDQLRAARAAAAAGARRVPAEPGRRRRREPRRATSPRPASTSRPRATRSTPRSTTSPRRAAR